MSTEPSRARPLGRTLRLLTAIGLGVLLIPVYLSVSWIYTLTSLGVVVALTLFYLLAHYLIARFVPRLNPWIGAFLAVTPVFLVWLFGQGGGPLFGQGEGATGALTYVGLSLLLDVFTADKGCEVMALPGLLFKRRTHLVCIAFSPVDWLEEKLAAGR